jgi:hypothetical protein
MEIRLIDFDGEGGASAREGSYAGYEMASCFAKVRYSGLKGCDRYLKIKMTLQEACQAF